MEPIAFPAFREFSSSSSSPDTPFHFIYPNNELPIDFSSSENAPHNQHYASLDGLLVQTLNIENPAELQDNTQKTKLTGKFDNRRRAQNRASQRAFRERKENYIKSLESQLSRLQDEHAKLLDSHQQQGQALDRMKDRVHELTNEIENLRCSVPENDSDYFTVFDLVPSAEACSRNDGQFNGNDGTKSLANRV